MICLGAGIEGRGRGGLDFIGTVTIEIALQESEETDHLTCRGGTEEVRDWLLINQLAFYYISSNRDCEDC